MSVDVRPGSLYLALRGRPLPPGIPRAVLLGFSVRKGVDAARGAVLGAAYSRGGLHFRGRRVTVTCPSRLTLGSGVVFGDDVVVEAYSERGVHLGDGVTVARGATLSASGVLAHQGVGITVGENTAIGARNTIWGQGGVSIGRDVLLGPNVLVVSENHGYLDPDLLIRLQPAVRAPVVVGDDCWLGAGVTVLAGVTIGPGCVVGAGAVVTADLPPRSVAVGVPARVVGTR